MLLKATVLVISILVSDSQVSAQTDSLRVYSDSVVAFQKTDSVQSKSKLEKAAFVIGSSLAFSLFDYIGYNLTRYESKGTNVAYRILQGTVQAGISYFLYKECGLSSAISFNLIWLTWGDDFGFYGWAYTTRIYPWWDNSGILHPDISWAGWTPVGLLRKQGSPIARSTLIGQAIIGFMVSIAIL